MDEPMLLDTSVAIETPEHVVFRYRVAGPARRMLAHLLDLALCYGLLIALVALVMMSAGGSSLDEVETATRGLGVGAALLLVFAAQWCWFVAWEAAWGTSPGKKACGLSVVTTQGRPIGFSEAALRNVLRAADVLPGVYVAGLGAMALSSRFQRIGDLVAGTMVIASERPPAASALRVWPPAGEDELRALPDDVRLDSEERAAIELFLRRRGTLGVARERELAGIVAGTLARRFGYRLPDPARALAVLYERASRGNDVGGAAPVDRRAGRRA